MDGNASHIAITIRNYIDFIYFGSFEKITEIRFPSLGLRLGYAWSTEILGGGYGRVLRQRRGGTPPGLRRRSGGYSARVTEVEWGVHLKGKRYFSF